MSKYNIWVYLINSFFRKAFILKIPLFITLDYIISFSYYSSDFRSIYWFFLKVYNNSPPILIIIYKTFEIRCLSFYIIPFMYLPVYKITNSFQNKKSLPKLYSFSKQTLGKPLFLFFNYSFSISMK